MLHSQFSLPVTIYIVFVENVHHHNHHHLHHHHHRVVTDRCAVPWPLKISVRFFIFSQTWLRPVCLSSVTCVHPTQGVTFRDIFAPYCSVAIRQLTHQNHEDRPRGSPPPSKAPITGVWLCDSSKVAPPIIKSRLAISYPDEFLVKVSNCWKVHRF